MKYSKYGGSVGLYTLQQLVETWKAWNQMVDILNGVRKWTKLLELWFEWVSKGQLICCWTPMAGRGWTYRPSYPPFCIQLLYQLIDDWEFKRLTAVGSCSLATQFSQLCALNWHQPLILTNQSIMFSLCWLVDSFNQFTCYTLGYT